MHFSTKGNFALTAILILSILVAVFAAARSRAPEPVESSTGWKEYENKDIGFSIAYPPNFTVYERTISEDDYFELAVDDPETGERYVYIRSYGPQSDDDRSADDYLTGPYPKQIPPTNHLPEQTAIERVLTGMPGVEVYGGQNDQFFYVYNHRLWVISLDPVIERHATPDSVEPGTPPRSESYKENYQSILERIRISGAPPLNEQAALAKLQKDMRGVAPHFVDSSEGTQQVLTPDDQRIKNDVAMLYAAQFYAEYPESEFTIQSFLLHGLFLSAIGERYILVTEIGAEMGYDEILDSHSGQVTTIPMPDRYVLAPERNTVLYIDYQALHTYSLDQASTTLIAGSQLSGNETYHNGEQELAVVVTPQETHTKDSITISVFDSSKEVANPDGGTLFEKLRDVTLSF